jgi:hypothetical protein
MFDYYVVSLVLSGIALLVSAFVAVEYFRAARDSGREPVRWTLIGWGVYLAAGVVAAKLLFLAAWLWERGTKAHSDIALADIFRTSWFLEAVPSPSSLDVGRLLTLLCALKLAMIVVGLIAAKVLVHAAGLKKPAGFDDEAKTVSFLGAAAALALIVWATVPGVSTGDEDLRGQLLYPNLAREDIVGLEISKFNEKRASEHDMDLAKMTPQEVAKALKRKPSGDEDNQRRWYIATHGYYPTEAKGLTDEEKKELTQKEDKPADAKKDGDAAETAKQLLEDAERRAAEFRRKSQLAQALGSLMGLRIEDVVGNSPGDHAGYGVIDPKTRKEGGKGCGTRVVLKGNNDKTLLALIIGKSVPNRPNMRFVRRVDNDTVYVVQIDPRNLPVRFAAWIEENLLKLNVLHARELDLLDFTFEARDPETTHRLSLASDDGSAWRLVVAADMKNGRLVKQEIPAGQELDTMKAGDIVNNLRDIEIIDVRRKPALLSRVLQGDTKDVPEEAFESLASSLGEHGFYLHPRNLYPRDGEIHCQMNDGVRYMLKFGTVAPTTEIGAKEADDTAEKQVAGKDEEPEQSPDKDKSRKTRYLFVMVDFNEQAGLAHATKEAAKGKSPKAKEEDPAEEDKDKAADKKDDKAADEAKEKTPAAKADKDDEGIQEILEQSRSRAADLNARFADWYYVISDDTYQKLHVTFDKLLREKTPEKPGDGEPGDGHDHGMDDGHDHGAEKNALPAGGPLREFEDLKRDGLE